MRYLILIVMLFIPAWGWAGDWEEEVKIRLMLEQRDREVTQDILEKHNKARSCEQRMREAMARMEAFLRKGDVIPTEDYARMKEQWDKTVADCVK